MKTIWFLFVLAGIGLTCVLSVQAAHYGVPRVDPIIGDAGNDPANAEDVEEWWAHHPFNPESPYYDMDIISPDNQILHIEPGVDTLQNAIDTLGDDGGTIYLTPGTYSFSGNPSGNGTWGQKYGFKIVGKSNVHIIAPDGAIVHCVTYVYPENLEYSWGSGIFGCPMAESYATLQHGYIHWVTGSQTDGMEACTYCVRNPVRNFYFENITFDGQNIFGASCMFSRAARDELFLNCTFRNYNDPYYEMLNMDVMPDNIWFVDCDFVNNTSINHVLYIDGPHGSGTVGCYFGSEMSMAFLYHANDDFTVDFNGDDIYDLQDQRIPNYNVHYQNTYEDSVYRLFNYSGGRLLSKDCILTGSAGNFGHVNARCSQMFRYDGCQYKSYYNKMIGNIMESSLTNLGGEWNGSFLRVNAAAGTNNCGESNCSSGFGPPGLVGYSTIRDNSVPSLTSAVQNVNGNCGVVPQGGTTIEHNSWQGSNWSGNWVAQPVFMGRGGNYVGSARVELFCATDGAEIRYTNNGSDPTSSSPLYTGPFNQNSGTVTYKSRAFKSGMDRSHLMEVTYAVINPSSPYLDVDAEHSTVPADGKTRVKVTIKIKDGSNNLVKANNPITLSVTGGTLDGYNPVWAANGIATTVFIPDTTGGTATITASSNGIAQGSKNISKTKVEFSNFQAKNLAGSWGVATDDVTPDCRIRLQQATGDGLDVAPAWAEFSTDGGDFWTTRQYTLVFEDLFDGGLDPRWTTSSVGGAPGSANQSGGILSITGGGTDVCSGSDQCYFVHAAIAGDFIAEVKVDTVNSSDNWTKVGLMVRNSTATQANNGYCHVLTTPAGSNNAYSFQWASDGNALCNHYYNAGWDLAGTRFPCKLRLVKSGKTFTAYYHCHYGSDTQLCNQWNQLMAPMEFDDAADTQRLGLYVCGHGTTATAEFDYIRVWRYEPLTPATCTGSDGTTLLETLTSSAIPFHQFTTALNRIRFCIQDMAGNDWASPEYTVPIVQQAGPASKIMCQADPVAIPADGVSSSVITAWITDDNGITVTDATDLVTFGVTGGGSLSGTNPVNATSGIATITLIADSDPSLATVTASADGLTGGQVNISMDYVDITPPSIPQDLQADSVSSSSVSISWSASTDDVGVTGYDVYRNGSLLTTVLEASYIDETVNGCGLYTYQVSACDAADNTSGLSGPLAVELPPDPQDADFDNDSDVDVTDVSLMAANWLSSVCGAIGDINADGLIDLIDFAALANNWNPEPPIVNLITNPSFENDMTGWGGPHGGVSGSVDSSVAHTGSASFKGDGAGAGGSGYIDQNPLTLTASTSYTMSVWVKTDGVSDGSPWIRYVQLNPTTMIYNAPRVPEGTSDWQLNTGTFTTESGYIDGRLDLIWDNDSGTVWFDDAQLTENN